MSYNKNMILPKVIDYKKRLVTEKNNQESKKFLYNLAVEQIVYRFAIESAEMKRKSADVRSFFAIKTATTTGEGVAFTAQQTADARAASMAEMMEASKEKHAAEAKAKKEKEMAAAALVPMAEWRTTHFAHVVAELKRRIALTATHESKVRIDRAAVHDTPVHKARRLAGQRKGLVMATTELRHEGVVHQLPNTAALAPQSCASADAGIKPKRQQMRWKDHPMAKEMAIALLIKNQGELSRTLRQLQRDDVLNATGIFDTLSIGTLGDWYKHTTSWELEGAKVAALPEHMQCPVSPAVLALLKTELVELGAAGATLNSTSLRPVFLVVLQDNQPEILPPPIGSGKFKCCASWINAKCCNWGFSMQRKTTTSHHLPDGWEALCEMMNLRLAYIVFVHNVPRSLVVGADESPIKAVANAELRTRHGKNSGDVFGIGKDNKLQFTCTPLVSAAGKIGARSQEEFEASGRVDEPELRTQCIGKGVERRAKGANKGEPLSSARPPNFAAFRELTWAQTPSHFAKQSSIELLFTVCLVPYYEAEIERLGLVGRKVIARLKAADGYDADDPAQNPTHQACVLKWDVYKCHRVAEILQWIHAHYAWIKLNFVPGGCTSKGQELDVLIQAQIQTGSKTKVSDLQIERIRTQRAAGGTSKVSVATSQLKEDMPVVLAAGLKHARRLTTEAVLGAFEKTGAAKAWDQDFQKRAVQLHADGKLFTGNRQEDSPYGQELEPEDLEVDQAALPDGAPPKPTLKKMSAQQLFVHQNRDNYKAVAGLKTLKEAEKVLAEEWKGYSKDEKDVWAAAKLARDAEFKLALRQWRTQIKDLTQLLVAADGAAAEDEEDAEQYDEAEGEEFEDGEEDGEEDDDEEDDAG